MKHFRIFLLILALVLIPTSVFAQSSKAGDTVNPSVTSSSKVVKSIEVQGNKSIGISTILSKIKTRVGQPYYQHVISDDLKRLYNTGYFSDVSVDRQDHQGGFKVILILVEKPIVEQVTFSKTRYIKRRAMLSKMKTKEGKFLNNKYLKDDISTIEELYSKKGLTLVEIDVEVDIDETTNKAKLHFIIKEGERVKIKRIDVYGNKFFRQRRIMRVIKTRADSLFTSGYLKADLLDEDMERIKTYYEQNGFIDATANFELDDLQDGRLVLKIYIEEGKRYYVESVLITGNHVLSDSEVEKVMTETAAGKPFSRERLTVDVSNIRTLYFDKGYIFANVRESTSLNAETGKVDVKLDVTEGAVAYVNKVNIQGNTRTKDIVVRRELKLNPGDRFDGTKLRRSKQRLRNLGYFEDINYDIEDTGISDKKDLVVNVKEAKTGTFSFGGGFSTVDKVVGFVEIEQKNFDFKNWPTFTGAGQTLVLRAEAGSVRNNYRLSFTEPWLFDYPVSFGFDGYRTERDRERDVGYAYDEERVGGSVRLGKSFTEFLSGGVSYTLEEVTIENIASDVSADLLAEAGESVVSTLGFTSAYDRRDSLFSPSTGYILSGAVDVAGGFLGGDKDFYRLHGAASYYIPVKFNSVVEFKMRAGLVDAYDDSDKVPIFERFFAGGARTIRGYDERKVGPIDPVTDDPIGGETLLIGNIEYTIPIIDFLKFATFFDIGNVWADIDDFGSGEFKSGMGVGLRVKTPIGPINLDYGYPLNDEPGEEERSGKFYFSVSRGF